MPLRRLRPGARERAFAKQDFLNGNPHLMGAGVRADCPHPRRQAWKGNHPHGVRNSLACEGSLVEDAVLDEQQDGPSSQVGIHGVL
jgi:hypothetical protein